MNEYKYAIGDKVRIATKEACKAWWAFNNKMEKYCDQVMTIREYSRETGEYYMEEDKSDWNNNDKPGWIWSEQCIVGKVEDEMFNINDLRTGDILVYEHSCYWRSPYEMIVLNTSVADSKMRMPVDIDCDKIGGVNWLSDIKSDMTTPSGKVIEVLRPKRPIDVMRRISSADYVTIWERSKAVKKMTVAEICEKLGYDVEVVRG